MIGVVPRSIIFACAALIATGTSSRQLWASACQGRIGPETSISGKTAYDPFSPTDLVDDYRISISNTGAEPCGFALLFRGRTARPSLGNTLAYEITSANLSLVTSAAASLAPLARLSTPLPPSATGTLEFQLVIPRGQFAPPDIYPDTIDLELYALDASGRASGAALQVATLAISYTAQRILAVNIAGAEQTTLSFGTLAEGQERSVTIQARSNLSYRLDVASDNRGALVLTPKLPGRDWSVPYSVTLAGQRLDLAAASSLRGLPPTRPEGDASFPLTVTIGAVGEKRAGHYQDVITIEIQPAAL